MSVLVKTISTPQRVIGASLFLGLCAQFAIPLPFTPVPISLQTLGVMLIANYLGPRLGALAILSYLAEGAMGLPVFAGFSGGVADLIGPTGGYLIGFLVAVLISGYLLERGWRNFPRMRFLAFALGSCSIWLLGASYLSHFVGGWQNAFIYGVAPFLCGDILKNTIATKLTRPR